MKTPLIVWLLGVVALLAATSVRAGPGGGGGHGHRFAEPGGMPMFSRQSMDRPMRGPEFRRDDMPMPGRMSLEERRQLRRDIRSAGDDIYRRPPPALPTADER
jgi:hypothetical protein